MFDITHTPVATTIARMAELIDAVAAANHQSLGSITDDITPFHSRAVPGISIRDYLERVAKFVFLENDTLLAVLVYLDRIAGAQRHRPALALSPFNIHRLAITAIVVAHKFTSDIFFNNARYSKVGGIPLAEMNQLELEMLFLVKFDLMVDAAELQRVGEWLLAHPVAPLRHQPPYGLLAQYYERQMPALQPHQLIPTPQLDPMTGCAHGAVPPLELAPCLPYGHSDPPMAGGRHPACHGVRPLLPRTHDHGCAEPPLSESVAALTTPRSMGAECQMSIPDCDGSSYEIGRPGTAEDACREIQLLVSQPGLAAGVPMAVANIGCSADAD